MTGRIDLGGHALNTQVDGPVDAPWIVLANSLGTNLTMWNQQMPMLTRHFRVLRYDTRGHGGSDTPPGPWSFDDFTGDVIALMDHFGIDRCAFMGLSMGGMTGLGLALVHPNRFDRVVCADARADAPAAFRQMWDERIARVRANGLQAIVEGTMSSWFTEDWLTVKTGVESDIRAMILGNDPVGYVACCDALKKLDYLRQLGEVGCPILYVGGDQDKGASPDVMAQMAARTPDGRYQTIEGAAHLANCNNPAIFNDIVEGFLNKVGAG